MYSKIRACGWREGERRKRKKDTDDVKAKAEAELANAELSDAELVLKAKAKNFLETALKAVLIPLKLSLSAKRDLQAQGNLMRYRKEFTEAYTKAKALSLAALATAKAKAEALPIAALRKASLPLKALDKLATAKLLETAEEAQDTTEAAYADLADKQDDAKATKELADAKKDTDTLLEETTKLTQ